MLEALFTASERRVVEIQLRECEAAHVTLSRAIAAKVQLYHQHAKRVEDCLEQRREYLSGFDGVLECEPAVAEAVLGEQRILMRRLDALYSVIDKPPDGSP